jgi:hypothetical protein
VSACPWCADPTSEAETGLCLPHEAERDGLTVDEVYRRDAEHAAEIADLA